MASSRKLRSLGFSYVFSLVLLVGLASHAPAAQVSGWIWSVTPTENRLTVTDAYGKDWIFTLDNQATLQVNNIPTIINSLMPGDVIQVSFRQQGDILVAYDVSAVRP
jgi:hypothetical protein